MSKKQKFIDYVEKELFSKENLTDVDEDVLTYWTALKSVQEKEKPILTDNGKIILKCLQDHDEIKTWKAKDIAETLFISARTVAGAIRKLVTDEFVEKIGEDPASYIITNKGKNIEIN